MQRSMTSTEAQFVGKLEKVMVLGVLGVVMMILTVSIFWTEAGPVGTEPGVPVHVAEGTGVVVPASVVDDVVAEAVALRADVPVAEDKPAPVIEDAGPFKVADAKPLPAAAVIEEAVPVTGYRPYRVRSLDTFASIAAAELGDERYADEIAKLNEDVDPLDLASGLLLTLPALDGLPSLDGEAGPATGLREIVVLDGDSLWRIAAREMGSGALWESILEVNRDRLDSADALMPGMRLRLP